jgi:NOL1/NOP2/sun family putative RNA methylase
MNQDYLNRMKEYLSKEDYDKLIEAYKESPSRSIRINKIEYETFIKNLNIPLEKIPYDPNGYYLNDAEKYGTHPYHHLGAIYFQEPSAMMPINLYDFKDDEKVLDLCAAPGGKSLQILSKIKNGILYANEPNKQRVKILFSNIERLGYKNAVILNNKPNELEKTFEGYFDTIVVDAPCSGEGMFRKDLEAQEEWSKESPNICKARDIEILDSAIKMLKEGGHLIYSTCTFSREEDCEIVSYLLEQGFILETPRDIFYKYTKEGFIKNTLRFYPFTGRGEGQFMALLKKVKQSECHIRTYKKEKNIKDLDLVKEFFKKNLDFIPDNIILKNDKYYLNNSSVDLSKLNVINYGVCLDEIVSKRFVPHHNLFKALGDHFINKVNLDINDPRVLHYLKGEEIKADSLPGFGVIIIDGMPLGGFKASNGILKNYYPKGLRNLKI